MNKPRRNFLMGAGAAAAATPAAGATSGKVKVQGGVRMGNLFFSSGLTGVRPDATDIRAQTHNILKQQKANLEALGSSLENVIKVTAFLADVKTHKPAFNEVYAQYFPKDPPARTALGAIFPDTQTLVEIELVAWIP